MGKPKQCQFRGLLAKKCMFCPGTLCRRLRLAVVRQASNLPVYEHWRGPLSARRSMTGGALPWRRRLLSCVPSIGD
jgi:hypothetical protein